MIFPTDQEYFKDIGSDGKLAPERFPKEQTTAHRAFVKSAEANKQGQLRVDYTRGKSEGDAGATQEEPQRLWMYTERKFSQRQPTTLMSRPKAAILASSLRER